MIPNLIMQTKNRAVTDPLRLKCELTTVFQRLKPVK